MSVSENNQLLFEILRNSLWSNKRREDEISFLIREELRAQTVEGLTAEAYYSAIKYEYIARFTQMAKVQNDAVNLIQDNGIPVAIIKGTASGMYYPTPYLRTYGDIDLLVQPDNYQKALNLMKLNGWIQEGEVGEAHTAFYKNGYLVELHQSLPGLNMVKEGKFIHEYICEGLFDIQKGSVTQPPCTFPVLPWKQNGLILIWHFNEHLYNGIGLRHVIDWMMFVNDRLRTNEEYADYRQVLERANLLLLAKTVTRMCQIYLGLSGSISWCKDADDSICLELMSFILEQGNFGYKKPDDKAAKVLSRYRTPLSFIRGLQQKGINEWELIQKHHWLRPFAWLYSVRQGCKRYMKKGGYQLFRADREERNHRQYLFDRLNGKAVASEQTSLPKWSQAKQNKTRKTIKRILHPVYDTLRNSFFRLPLYYIQELFFFLSEALMGRPHISHEDIVNVEQNVTFVFKSFNRQKLACRCYRRIKAYYPNARVVIADDSKEQLDIVNMSEGDMILHLPFNSGLSKGLIAALAEVKTPFTMRLDDDELLTPSSRIHEQLAYLQKHTEVDLVGLQPKYIRPKDCAKAYSQIKMNRQLIIPAGTVIDGREVVYKTADIFLVRTESYRKIGYDPNIRMIIHQEFFYRAAGQIVSVQDSYSYILHWHNRFENKEYMSYRGDYAEDMKYIAKKHGHIN